MKKTEKTKGRERSAAKKRQTMIFMAAGVIVCIAAAIILFLALSQAAVKTGDTVSVLYVGTLANGSVFDSNVNKTPLSFTVGSHTVIPGFEDAVAGMTKGQVKTVTIPADKAYGQYREDLVTTVNRSLFSAEMPPVAGLYYTLTSPADGSAHVVKVINVTKNVVTIDQNHMLAGQDLTFTIRVVGINLEKGVAK